ncbi:MAG: helix-turn-helix domain-containing protein [Nitrospirales bacterium]
MNGQMRTGVLNGKDEPEYLTGEQLAATLQVSVKTIWRWAKLDPTMPTLVFARTVRFPRERLMRWLRAREQGSGRGKQIEQLLPSPSQPTETIEQSLTVSGPCAHS